MCVVQLVLEESRREAAREERRRRQQRREKVEALEEEVQRTRVADEICSSSRKIDDALSALSAAQSLTEVLYSCLYNMYTLELFLLQAPIPLPTADVSVVTSAGDCGDDQSTPPLGDGGTLETPHSTVRRTPLLQVTKLPTTVRSTSLVAAPQSDGGGGGREDREWLDDTPPLVGGGEMREEEEEEGERVGGIPQDTGGMSTPPVSSRPLPLGRWVYHIL